MSAQPVVADFGPSGAGRRGDDHARSIAAALARAQQARSRLLNSSSSTRRIITTLAETAAAWQCRDFAPRRRLLERLPKCIKLAAPMIERGLDFTFSAVNAHALQRLVAEQARGSLLGPSLIYYALPGNIPGLAIAPIVVTLLARSVCLIRDSARQPLLTAAFIETLADRDAELAAMVVADSWEHGCEAAALRQLIIDKAERIELYGHDATLAEIAPHYANAASPRKATLVTRGARLSVGVISRDADPADWAAGFAEDVAMYDGLGCLSPQLILVEGHADRARRFVDQLGRALDECQSRWPRQHRNPADEASRRAFIDAAELAAASNDSNSVLRGDGDAWCIHFTPSHPLSLGPGLRCVSVSSSNSRAAILARLRASSLPLAGVGLALADSSDVANSDYAGALRECGATLVCAPGGMQAPPISWCQDGLPRLSSLLEQQ